jgi:hypothetical protein
MKLSVILIALSLTACASLGNLQPVRVMCMSCQALAMTGACDTTQGLVSRAPACPVGEAQYVTNYVDVVKHASAPKVECRSER